MTRRLTVAQGIISFLQNQYVERDGRQFRFFEGCFGIFGHGNVAGMGQALEQDPGLRYYLFRNEQAMVHAAVAFAKATFRMRTMVCTSSIGPGATNMVTGAALATINRLPVLLLAGRYLCQTQRRAGITATGVARDARYFGKRLLQASLALLGPHSTPRAIADFPSRSGARADFTRGNRSCHSVPASGRASRGLRLSRGVFRINVFGPFRAADAMRRY